MDQKQQKDLEDRFNCPICLSPRLRMVAGMCQHRVCVSCIYDDTGARSLPSCPVCQQASSFPERRPIIPEDAVLMQRRLGVVECTYEGCGEEMWEWELPEHQRQCPHLVIVIDDSPSTPPRRARPRVTVQAPDRPRRRQQTLVRTTRTSTRRVAIARQQRASVTGTPGRMTPGRRVAGARRTPARRTRTRTGSKRPQWRL